MIRRLAVCLALLAGPAAAQSTDPGSISTGDPARMPETCLDGVVEDRTAIYRPLPDPAVCPFDGACSDQDAVSMILTFRQDCQEQVLQDCLEADASDACLLPLGTRFSSEAQDLRRRLETRLDGADLSGVPRLLSRRLSDPARWTAPFACDPGIGAFYGADPAYYCTAARASEARLALERLHYALDKAGIAR